MSCASRQLVGLQQSLKTYVAAGPGREAIRDEELYRDRSQSLQNWRCVHTHGFDIGLDVLQIRGKYLTLLGIVSAKLS